ncbi:MAG: hypothetical protein J6V88_06215, partial [Kiritimatiellae bacterium]|nr:hypothetical protein [Kiritimatiellia bacterium]
MKKMIPCFILIFVSLFAQVAEAQLNTLRARGGRNFPRSSQMQTPQLNPLSSMTKEPEVEVGTNGYSSIVFNEAPISTVLAAYANQLGKTIIPAPGLPESKITMQSLKGQELTKEEYLAAIEAKLVMEGVVLEPFGEKFLRAIPRKSARKMGIRTRMNVSTNALPEMGRMVSQLIRLRYISAEEAQKAIEGFKDDTGLFQVFERNNSILVTDTEENVNRMLEIIREIDVATPILEVVRDVQITNAAVTEIKTVLETIVTELQKDESGKSVSSAAPRQTGSIGMMQSDRSRRLSTLRGGLLNRTMPQEPANTTMMANVSEEDKELIRGKVVLIADERSNKLIIITRESNLEVLFKVIHALDVPTTPEVMVEVFRMEYADAEEVSSMLNDLIGNGSSSSSNAKDNKNAAVRNTSTQTRQPTTSGNKATRTAQALAGKLGELNKDNIKILADKRINAVVVMARTADMAAIKDVIKRMDVRLSQVLIETVIVQVELGDELSTGIDWIKRGRKEGNSFANGDMMAGGGGSGSSTLKNFTGTGESMAEKIAAMKAAGIDTSDMKANEIAELAKDFGTTTANPIGGGLNYFLKSDKLDLSAVIQMAKSDSRTKVLASPILMTVDNKEATIEATDMIYLFAGYQYSGSSYNGTQVRNYDKRDIGLTVTVTPRINPNGTVVLSVAQKFETQGADQNVPNESGGTDPYATVTTRKIESDISVENKQTVVMGGLTRKTNTESESGTPILKDIPYIGKWIFGSVSQTEKRSELLVFMTP